MKTNYKLIQIKPLIGPHGAEIGEVNLQDEMSDATFAEIHQAFLQYKIIVFRNQDIDYQKHIDFGKRFGKLFVHPFVAPIQKYPELIRLLKKPNDLINNGGALHFDLTFLEEPPKASILRLIDVPETGGDTIFNCMYSAYDALSASMKKYLEGLRGLHTSAQLFGPTGFYRNNKSKTSMIQIPNKKEYITTHPLVRTNPETGRKGLFINPMYVEKIMDVPIREGNHILEFLYNHCAKAEFSTRVSWKKDTITMWDNRSAMHHAINDYQGQHREGIRITIEGTRPY
jgi:taurine dioxygenase|tara:strand:+ start:2155 stop:3009 length:855 start_codon:yes stop_codon:yes gene_type:complete